MKKASMTPKSSTGLDIDSLIEQKAKIISHFDFKKVHSFMTMINWVWVNLEDGSVGIPSLPRITGEADKVMNGAIDDAIEHPKRRGYCGCGGFDASVINGKLSLQFVADSETIKIRTVICGFSGDENIDKGIAMEEF